MGCRPFPSERGTPGLDQNFHREMTNGKGLVLLKELEIGSSPDLFSVEADRIDPCLSDDQKGKVTRSQVLKVLGLNKNGLKWNLQLRKENGTYFFTEERRKKMTAGNGWGRGTKICIWGAHGGIFRDGVLRFVLTKDM